MRARNENGKKEGGKRESEKEKHAHDFFRPAGRQRQQVFPFGSDPFHFFHPEVA